MENHVREIREFYGGFSLLPFPCPKEMWVFPFFYYGTTFTLASKPQASFYKLPPKVKEACTTPNIIRVYNHVKQNLFLFLALSKS